MGRARRCYALGTLRLHFEEGNVREKGRECVFVSHRVKISFVTAAMLYSSRRALQRASIRAVLPDPTGLLVKLIS